MEPTIGTSQVALLLQRELGADLNPAAINNLLRFAPHIRPPTEAGRKRWRPADIEALRELVRQRCGAAPEAAK